MMRYFSGIDDAEYTIGADLLEVISFVGAAVVTGGGVRIRNAGIQHLEMISHIFRRMGVVWTADGKDLLVSKDQPRLIIPDMDGAIPEVKTNVWPAFPTDLISCNANDRLGFVSRLDVLGPHVLHRQISRDGSKDYSLRSLSLSCPGSQLIIC